MENSIPASRWIVLATDLEKFRACKTLNTNLEYVALIESVIVLAGDCQLSHTYRLAKELGAFVRSNSTMSQVTWSAMQGSASAIHTTLLSEAFEKKQITLATESVSERLRQFPAARMKDTQIALQEETIRCLETDANRSACVMGWNFAYDLMRQWVFDNKLSEFNAELTKNSKLFPRPITDYDEFFELPDLGEYLFIETCKKANLFNGKLFDRLKEYLKKRNQYAHPNTSFPTTAQANSYIEDLLDVLDRQPFK